MASVQRVELRGHPTSPTRWPSLIFAGLAAGLFLMAPPVFGEGCQGVWAA